MRLVARCRGAGGAKRYYSLVPTLYNLTWAAARYGINGGDGGERRDVGDGGDKNELPLIYREVQRHLDRYSEQGA